MDTMLQRQRTRIKIVIKISSTETHVDVETTGLERSAVSFTVAQSSMIHGWSTLYPLRHFSRRHTHSQTSSNAAHSDSGQRGFNGSLAEGVGIV